MPIAHDGHASTSAADRPRRPLRSWLAVLMIVGSAALAVVPVATATAASHKHARRHRQAGAARACAGANARVGHASAKFLRSAVVCLINRERLAHHLPALKASPALHRSAQGWTDAMVSSDQFTHGTNFASRISAAGFVWRSAGENIATGFATPRAVVGAWMASTGHCQNILNPTFREVGTGLSPRPVRGYATGAGTWTQDFALGMSQSPPSGNYGPMDGCPY